MTEEQVISDEVERLPDTELEWGGEEPAPKKKRGCLLPTWLWACGGGCLLLTLLIGAGLFWGVGQVKNLVDPEVQWPRLQKVLPFDERPEGMQMITGMQMFGMENYTLMDLERGLQISVYYFDDNDSSDADDSRWTFFLGFLARGRLFPFPASSSSRSLFSRRFTGRLACFASSAASAASIILDVTLLP